MGGGDREAQPHWRGTAQAGARTALSPGWRRAFRRDGEQRRSLCVWKEAGRLGSQPLTSQPPAGPRGSTQVGHLTTSGAAPQTCVWRPGPRATHCHLTPPPYTQVLKHLLPAQVSHPLRLLSTPSHPEPRAPEARRGPLDPVIPTASHSPHAAGRSLQNA